MPATALCVPGMAPLSVISDLELSCGSLVFIYIYILWNSIALQLVDTLPFLTSRLVFYFLKVQE